MFPRVISRRINSIMEKFLWSGSKLEVKFNQASWSTLPRPIEGGWRFMESEKFSKSIVIINMWHELNRSSLWHDVIRGKYTFGQSLSEWIRGGAFYLFDYMEWYVETNNLLDDIL